MSLDASELLVIVPDRFGASVVTAADLLSRLADDESFDDAVANSAIDMWDGTPEHMDRIRALNATGDAGAYWDPR